MGYRYNSRSSNYSNNNCTNNNIDWEEFSKLAGTYGDANEAIQKKLAEAAEHLSYAYKAFCDMERYEEQSRSIWGQMEQWMNENYSNRYNCCQTICCDGNETRKEAEQAVSEVKQHMSEACSSLERVREYNYRIKTISNEVVRRCIPRHR